MTCSSLSDELQKQVHCSGIGGNQRKEKLGSSLKASLISWFGIHFIKVNLFFLIIKVMVIVENVKNMEKNENPLIT